mmetsp:Transcript_29819/g.81893  ORF Transcript_29819/g.81893 Transcript_29819/m.81893 type:complete len:118 (-) Transcript_29819:61-414(-)
MFGTFVPEEEKRSTYGLGKTIPTFDPVAANVQGLIRYAKQKRSVTPNDHALGFLRNPLLAVWRYISQRRVRHPFVFRPRALLDSLPDGDIEKSPDETHQGILFRKSQRSYGSTQDLV